MLVSRSSRESYPWGPETKRRSPLDTLNMGVDKITVHTSSTRKGFLQVQKNTLADQPGLPQSASSGPAYFKRPLWTPTTPLSHDFPQGSYLYIPYSYAAAIADLGVLTIFEL